MYIPQSYMEPVRVLLSVTLSGPELGKWARVLPLIDVLNGDAPRGCRGACCFRQACVSCSMLLLEKGFMKYSIFLNGCCRHFARSFLHADCCHD